MRLHIPAVILATVLPFASAAQAQFLNLPQYDNHELPGGSPQLVEVPINTSGQMALVGPNGGTIIAILSNGVGGFEATISTTITVLNSPKLIAVGDFNGDGLLDAAVGGIDPTTSQNAVAVLFGNGNGTFQAGIETILGAVGAPTGGCTTTAADFNGDGKLDLAYTYKTSVVVLTGNGNGTFSAPQITSTGSAPFACVASGDFNNDSKIDLAAATPAGQIGMLLGKGNGTFQSPFGVGKAGGLQIIAAQLNADNNLDLVTADENSPTVTLLFGDGTGHFPTTSQYTGIGATLITPMVVQDLNGDNHPDIAFLSEILSGIPRNEFINIFLNNGDGTFTPGNFYNADGVEDGYLSSGGVSIGVLAGDINGDNKPDLVVENSSGGLSVLLGNGNGTFQGNVIYNAFGYGVEVAQLTGPTKPGDLLLGAGEILLGNGDGTFTTEFQENCLFGSIAIGDFNGDHKLDIAGPTTFEGNVDTVIRVCLGNGNGTFQAPSGDFDEGIEHGIVISADFNNDGKLDLAASDDAGVSILLGNGNGTFQPGIETVVSGASPYPRFVVGDFNNDGKMDFAVTTSSGIAVYPGNGNGTFRAPIISPGPPSGYFLLTVTDLNKDGNKDLVIVDEGGPIYVMLGNGNGKFKAPVRYSVPGSSSTRAVVADYNQDGNPDVAVGTLTSGVAVFFGDGSGKLSTTPTIFRTGVQVEAMATSDFNGDKKPDLAVVLNDGYTLILLNQ